MREITMLMSAVRRNEAVSVKVNLRSEVKRSGRSQNRRLQKGLPA